LKFLVPCGSMTIKEIFSVPHRPLQKESHEGKGLRTFKPPWLYPI
jgi:hypothetical protein